MPIVKLLSHLATSDTTSNLELTPVVAATGDNADRLTPQPHQGSQKQRLLMAPPTSITAQLVVTPASRQAGISSECLRELAAAHWYAIWLDPGVESLTSSKPTPKCSAKSCSTLLVDLTVNSGQYPPVGFSAMGKDFGI